MARQGGRIDAVLFDLDGTLVVTHIDFQAMRAGVAAVAAAWKVPAAETEGLDTLTAAVRSADFVRAHEGDGAARAFALEAEEAMIEAEMRGLEGAGPAPFAVEVLAALREGGVGVAIVTRNCRRAAEEVLALAGIDCPVLLTRDDVARYKPDPLHLLEALGRLGAAPDAAVMVGDHLMDIEAGHAAGTRTAGVLTPGRSPDYFDVAHPDLVVADLRGLLPFVLGES